MTKKYAVLNPNEGSYQRFDTTEEAINAAIDIAFAFYLHHTHNQPFADITINEDGSEIWQALDGSSMLSPEQLAAESEKMDEHIQSFVNAQKMQITTL
jgi:hypothetical protein